MKTTQIIIEHLIAGIQMIVWILLLVFIITGTDWLQVSDWDGYESILIAFLLSLVYPLGIIIDNISDFLLKGFESRIRSNIKDGDKSMRKLLIKLKDIGAEEHFDYIRTRIRICRSAAVNFSFTTIFSIIYTIVHHRQSPNFFKILSCEILIGTVIIILAYYSWLLLIKSFYSKLGKRYREVNEVN